MSKWSIYDDLSGVAQVTDGKFDTELEAQQRLVEHAASNLSEAQATMSKAKRDLRRIKARAEKAKA